MSLTKMIPAGLIALLLFLLSSLPAPFAGAGTLPEDGWAVRGAILHTMGRQGRLENATLLVREGKIEAVGRNLEVPEGFKVLDGRGKHVTPGFIDLHSHIMIGSRPYVSGNRDWNEWSDPITPQLRALDSLNPRDPAIREAIASGVTSVNIVTGSDNLISGRTTFVKLSGANLEEMVVRSVSGMKMANGDSPIRYYSSRNMAPMSRMSAAAMVREEFLRARRYRDYRKAEQASTTPESEAPGRSLELEAMAAVLDRKIPVHFHTGYAHDILTAIRLSEEFGFELICHHCTEGYKIAEELAARNIPAVVFAHMGGGDDPESLEMTVLNPVLLSRAGVRVALHTDHPIMEQRYLLFSASLVHKFGLSESESLQMITRSPAEIIHLDHRLGSLEAGKDADLVILDGPPLDLRTHVLQTMIDGRIVFDRNRQLREALRVRHGN